MLRRPATRLHLSSPIPSFAMALAPGSIPSSSGATSSSGPAGTRSANSLIDQLDHAPLALSCGSTCHAPIGHAFGLLAQSARVMHDSIFAGTGSSTDLAKWGVNAIIWLHVGDMHAQAATRRN